MNEHFQQILLSQIQQTLLHDLLRSNFQVHPLKCNKQTKENNSNNNTSGASQIVKSITFPKFEHSEINSGFKSSSTSPAPFSC